MCLVRFMAVGMAFGSFLDVAETGGGICNTCGSFADGFALLMWINGWDFGRTIREVAEQVGSQPSRSPPIRRSEAGKSDDEIRREQLNRTWRESVPLSHPKAEPARLVSGSARSVGQGAGHLAVSSRAGLLRGQPHRGRITRP
jgi:hypothetical protein